MRPSHLLFLVVTLAAGCKRVTVPSDYVDVVPTAGLQKALEGKGNPALGDPPSLMLWYDKEQTFDALHGAFAAKLAKIDGELLLDCKDEGGFDLAVVKAPRQTTMVTGDAKRGFVSVMRSNLTDISGPKSGTCKLTAAAKKLCDPSRSTDTECHLKVE
jgi:hypothetical protein